MKAFLLTEQKQFMNQLLRSELFDHFLISEATIQGAISYTIDGHINRAFYDSDELETIAGFEYLPFAQFRPVCFELIKGKHTPLYMKFIFLLSPENAKNVITSSQTGFTCEDISAIFMNVTFKDERLILTTGVSYRTFTPDHSFDEAWDKLTARFLSKNGILFDIL
ncbi:MAG: DUF5721 family protein [bacterium]|nr:DUF5721 family protein [bacterium]